MSNSKNWSGGSTRAWRKLRQRILDRDNHVCQMKITGICTYRADCVHHLNGKANGDDPKYLVSSCTACNLHIGDPTRTSTDPEPLPFTLLD